MEPWEESLDLDDSDIPSLLRPCKRLHHHQHQTSISAAALSQPTLKPCSNHPQTQEEEESVGRQNSCHNSTERRRIIPGPAGAVQSAMLQKSRDREKQQQQLLSSDSCNVDPISTQEYIRRAVENAPEFDDDFSSNPWLSALQFIGSTVDGVVPSVPLNSINQCANHGKVDQVVAVIKSCTQSSLGGLMVTLKDPTGTIGASVHQKVLSESQFAKDFCIGSVLILQKVAIFSPSKTVHYLNIMPRNLVKVFNKDNGTMAKHNSLDYSVKYVTPGEECFGKGGSPQKMLISENGSLEEMIDGMKQNINVRGNLDVNDQIESGNLLPQSLTRSSGSGLKGNLADEEPLTVRQDVANKLFEEAAQEKTTDDKQRFSLDKDRQPKVGNISERLQDNDVVGSFMKEHVQEIQENNRVQKQRQQLFTAALPQWTDEQLEELFADHDEDEGSFF